MKILDRYVLAAFLKNYLISLLVLIGLYVVLDMVFQFDEFTENAASTVSANALFSVVAAIADYYFYQSFVIFAHLAGIIPLVAAAFTLVRMTRNNELTAFMAAGVPLLRIVAPIIFAAVVLNVFVVLDQEVLIPTVISKVVRKPDSLMTQTSKASSITAMRDESGGLLNVSQYFPASSTEPARMVIFDLIERNDNGDPIAQLRADEAIWDQRAGHWNLTNGERITGLLPEQRRSTPQPIKAYKSSITPDEIALHSHSDFVDFFSTEHINELLTRQQSFNVADLLRVKHTRLGQWILNLVLLLLAIPCVLSREPTQLKQAAMKTLVLVGACMGLAFVCQQLAGQTPPWGPNWADYWPAIMAWVPIVVFGITAVVLLDRLHTKGS